MMKLAKHGLFPLLLLTALTLFLASGCGPAASLDMRLQAVIVEQELRPLEPGPAPDPEKVRLGEALFFDKILSGNKDISCATCHHPSVASGDGLSVSIGTGGEGLGPQRQIGYGRDFIPRNAPEVFNRGALGWTSMFWDSRVRMDANGYFLSPAGSLLPEGLDSVLAVQAMFPVTSEDEMRGSEGDLDVFGQENEMAQIDSKDLPAMWDTLMARLLAYPEYVDLFAAAYPSVATSDLDFQHAANAIAAFEIDAFTFVNAPWEQYLNGDTAALSDQAKVGALLFFGEAGCAECHSGPLFTDQDHHVLAVPQVGPGKGNEAPLDFGRFRETGAPADLYAFRTPPLHNVAVTGPWMHDGAYATLEAVIRHHLDPAAALQNYDPTEHLPPELYNTYQNEPALIVEMIEQVDPLLAAPKNLSDKEIQQLVAFLESLTDPGVLDLEPRQPTAVPSGLPVTDEVIDANAN